MNWVRIEEPSAGSSIRTNDGKRVRFPVTVRDSTGTLTIYIQEYAALRLSGIIDAEQFEPTFLDGKIVVSENGISENPPPAQTKCCTAWGPARAAT
jgi:hypothetical protein